MSGPTPEQIAIGGAILQIEAGLATREAERIAADVYREMQAARPPPSRMKHADLTPAQWRFYLAIQELTSELGRYPTVTEIARHTGASLANTSAARRRLQKKGFVRIRRRSYRMFWLKPLD